MRVKVIREKIVKIAKEPAVLFCVVFIIMDFILTQLIVERRPGLIAPVLIGELLAEILMVWFLMRGRKKGWPIEKMFLIVAIVLGVMFIIFLPPGQSPDENIHFRRAYGITDGFLVADVPIKNDKGDVVGVGSPIPEEINMLSDANVEGTYKQKIKWAFQSSSGETREMEYSSAALYSPLCYLPQIIGVFIGKIANMSVMGMAYLMKIFNFVVWILLVYFGIKLLPKFKKMAIFIALLPITLQEATSISPDALTIGLAIFLVGYVMNLVYGRKGLLKKWDWVILTAVGVMLAMCKIVYLPLVLLYLTIPVERFGTKKKKWIGLAIVMSIIVAADLIWLAVSFNTLAEFHNGTVDPKGQLMGIIGAPTEYVGVVFRTFDAYLGFWISTMLGMSLSWLSVGIPEIFLYISWGILVILLVQKDETIKLKVSDRIIYIISFVSIVLLILTSLYLQWTPVGETKVAGVQGRYFLPILLLLPVMLCNTKTKLKTREIITGDKVVYYGIFVNMIAFVTFFVQNW